MAPAVMLLAAFAQIPPTSAGEKSNLVILSRSIDQDQGGWLVSYRLQYRGLSTDVRPTEILATLEGDLSNSRVAAHAIPRWSSATITGLNRFSGSTDLIPDACASQRCQEQASLIIWTGDGPAPVAPQSVITLSPSTAVHVQLKLEHLHEIYGEYDPLLGIRQLNLHLGSSVLRDTLPMDREQYLAQAKCRWKDPPTDRIDMRWSHSGKGSLFLDAAVPGCHFYRFGERPVRYATKMRLRFWYFVARGTEGDCVFRIGQYQNVPSQWRVLREGAFEECLPTVGRWAKIEKIFRTEPEATELSLDFRITSEVGALWVDDVSLEPVGPGPPRGP